MIFIDSNSKISIYAKDNVTFEVKLDMTDEQISSLTGDEYIELLVAEDYSSATIIDTTGYLDTDTQTAILTLSSSETEQTPKIYVYSLKYIDADSNVQTLTSNKFEILSNL